MSPRRTGGNRGAGRPGHRHGEQTRHVGLDTQQQFGRVGLILAVAGAVRLWWISRAWGWLVWSHTESIHCSRSLITWRLARVLSSRTLLRRVCRRRRRDRSAPFKTTGPSPRRARSPCFTPWPPGMLRRGVARVGHVAGGQSASDTAAVSWPHESHPDSLDRVPCSCHR